MLRSPVRPTPMLLALVATLVATALVAVCGAGVAQAFIINWKVNFGMVGITPRDQVARLNAVLISEPDDRPIACRVTLRFLDAAGRALAEQQYDLRPNAAVSLDVAAIGNTGIVLDSYGRVQLRAQVQAQAIGNPDTLPADACRRLVTSVEVFDRVTGRTTVVLDGGKPSLVPPVDPR